MYHIRPSRFTLRLKNALVAALFVGTQIAMPLGAAGLFVGHAAAVTPTNCVVDTAGPNDEPGQKDLTQLCIDESGLANNPKTEDVSWNWDDTGTSGNNSLDACSLFDTNGNGNVDYAVCVTTENDPAQQIPDSPRIYSCGDAKVDRCTSPATLITGPYSSTCTVSQTGVNPFDNGTDTKADCTLVLSEVGGNSSKLVDVCSYPSQEPNSDPSDCVIIQPKSGKVTVEKHLVPSTDSGLFNLQVDGTTKAANVGDNGTTGVVVVSAATHTVGELAGTNTSLSSYNSSIECKDLNGQGSVVGSNANGTSSSVTVADGSDIVCVITNTVQQATLILQKTVINDNGGTLTQSSFPVAISGTTAQWGSNSVGPGTYTVAETQQPGYQAGSWGGDCSPTGGVTLAPGATATCTLTNDDIAPQLTVIKQVVNDNGGTAVASNFTMNVTGDSVSTPSFPGAASPGTTVTLNAGTYGVDEGSYPGYAKTLGADCSGTIAIGEHKTCTITNDDIAPLLTTVKNVTNDNGGTAVPTNWTLTATPTSGQTLSGSGGFSSQAAKANVNYTLSESGPSGYNSPSGWSCDSGTFNGSVLSLSVGDNVTCQITNDDIAPVLTVTKVVVNNDGGTLQVSSFPLFVGSVQVTSGVANSFSAGTYTVSETQQTGYILTSIGGNCSQNGSITMVVGGVYNCTLTNDDQPANIKVTKNVINDNGGTAGVSDFKLLVGATQVTSGASNTFAANQSYTVSEQALVNGYTQTSLTCVDADTGASLGATFTPTNGEHVNCIIVNDDVAPTITVIKHVVNDNGGTAVAANFTMNVTGTSVSNPSFAGAETPGTVVTLNAGTYSVDESAASGYTKTLSTDCSGTVAVGENKTCVVTNDDQQATLTLVKHVINDNGGNQTANDFQAYVGQTPVSWSSATSLNAASYTASEHQLPGYTATVWSGDCAADGSITLLPGQHKTCEITNNDIPPTLTIVKNVTNDNGGTVLATDFKLRVNGTQITGATASNAGLTATYTYASSLSNTSYAVTEDSTDGYTLTSKVCTDNDTHATVTQPVVLNEGQNVTCVLANDDQAPHLSLHKHVTNNDGGTAVATDWTVTATPADSNFATITGAGDASGTAQANLTYTLTEAGGPTGYAAGNWTCDAGTLNGNQLSLAPGVSASCDITNNDVPPTLTLVKHVTNDNGGNNNADDWTLTAAHANDTPLINEKGTANSSGTVATTNQAIARANTTYNLSESGPSGYSASTWSCTGGTLNGSTLTLALDTDVTCTITNNDQPASITLTKVIVNDSTGLVQPDDFNLTIDGNPALSGHTYDVTSNTPHTIGEGSLNNYKFVQIVGATEADDAYCSTVSASLLLFGTITLDEGQHVSCVITNTKLTTITVHKITQFADGTTTNDPQDFSFTTSGQGLNDFSLDTDNSDATLSDTVTFDNLTPGQNEGGYTVNEDTQAVKDTWTLDQVNCGETELSRTDSGVTLFPRLGEDVVCTFVNTKAPVVNIAKTNNRPQATVVGDTVTYTLVVTVPDASQSGGAPVYDTTVTDLPPSQFTYVPGSWTATSNVPGHDVAADVVDGSPITGEPTYGSPGIWHIGKLLPGEIVTLTYKAVIGAGVSDGTYPDLAFVKGAPAPAQPASVVGNLSFASTPFVTTAVTVATPLTPKVFTAGQVLGAEILVNTGTSILSAQYILPLLLLAGVGISRRATHYKESGGK